MFLSWMPKTAGRDPVDQDPRQVMQLDSQVRIIKGEKLLAGKRWNRDLWDQAGGPYWWLILHVAQIMAKQIGIVRRQYTGEWKGNGTLTQLYTRWFCILISIISTINPCSVDTEKFCSCRWRRSIQFLLNHSFLIPEITGK